MKKYKQLIVESSTLTEGRKRKHLFKNRKPLASKTRTGLDSLNMATTNTPLSESKWIYVGKSKR